MRNINIVQGEHAQSADAEVMISTLLGSCIAVCLYDPVVKTGGMNHFLLGEPEGTRALLSHEMQCYGLHSMELLINAMMQLGASRTRLRAHLYGGANVVAGLGAIGTSNIAFARRFLATENIPVGHEDVGGGSARKVEFLPHIGRSRVVSAKGVALPPPPPKAPLPEYGDLEMFA